MKQVLNLLIILLFMLLKNALADEVHWTAKVKWVSVHESESASIALTAPYAPNPVTAIWECGNGVVALSKKDLPAPKAMLSTALTLYATQKTVRIGVRGTGADCEAWYLSARE